MERIVRSLIIGFLVSILGCSIACAQGTAQINGTARDQSGAVLPGVDVTATKTDTGITRTTVTNETGGFVLPNLAPGPYRLEAGLPGFRTFVQTGIVLQVNSNPAFNVVLEVGQVAEQVEVQANAALVETRTVGVGQVIENERILELPLNGRQVTDLIVLTGAAVQTGTSDNRNMRGMPAISVAGGLPTGTVYTLDGVINNDPYNNLSSPFPFPDALQEFKVETSALSAQYGMYSGASVTSVTKSGTNEFHGDLFEFVRNDLFNARNYFATKGSTLKRNQFGGTLGGPIKANKVFFFGGFQGTTLRQDPADNRAFIPTAAMLAGDFTAFTSPACNGGRQITLRAPFVNNRIDPGQFSRTALTIANKLPQTSDPCGTLIYGQRSPLDDRQYVGKGDYQWNDKHSLFGRYLATSQKAATPYSLDENLLTTATPGADNLAQAYAIGHTYLINPNTVNSYRLAVNRTSVHRVGARFFSGPDVGSNIFSSDPKYMSITVTGGFNVGGSSSSEATYRTTVYQTSNDLSLVRGTHQISIGAAVAHWRNNLNAAVFGPGTYTFNGQETGSGLSDFLTGRLSQYMQADPNRTYMKQWYLGLYTADTWKATPKLTVNYGIRWEPWFPQVLRNGQLDNFSEERYKNGIKSTVFKNAPFGFYYPGDPGYPGNCKSLSNCQSSGMRKQWANVAPRLGLAWDPQGDGRMSIRASYAMGYDLVTGRFYNTLISPPWLSSIIVPTPAGGLENPWQGYPGGNPFPVQLSQDTVFVPAGNYYSIPYDPPSTTRHSWNLSVQRQIATDWLASASYMGSQAVHLWTLRQVNSAIYFPGGPCTIRGVTYNPCSTTANINARRRLALEYPNVGGTTISYLNSAEPGGTQSYHGLLLSVQRRASRGVVVGANYTWSHCLGDTESKQEATGTPPTSYLNPNDRDFDRGNCAGDRRQIFNTTAVAEMPQFTNPTLRVVATGWRLSGIYRYSTGQWLSVFSGVDRALNGVNSQRAQQILGNPYGDNSLTRFLNPSAFTLPELGTLGNMRPNNVEGPATWQFDLSLSRSFNFRESQRLEVRAEAFNVTNSLRRGNPNTTLTSATFGQILTSLDPRIMQFALKYVF